VVDKEFSWTSKLIRYFLHGIAFSTLLLLLAFVWVFILAILTMVGFIIGFIIGFIVLFFFVGGLNTSLTDFIWSTPIESGGVTLFIHGIGLFLILLVVSLPSFLLTRILPSLATSIFVFVAYAFIDGFIAKNLAFVWKEEAIDFSDRDEIPSEPTTTEPSVETEEVDAELLYDELLKKYVDHWGAQTGTQLLNNEIKAYTWQGETFDEAVKRVYQRQKRASPK
jgi:hypothetical protein